MTSKHGPQEQPSRLESGTAKEPSLPNKTRKKKKKTRKKKTKKEEGNAGTDLLSSSAADKQGRSKITCSTSMHVLGAIKHGRSSKNSPRKERGDQARILNKLGKNLINAFHVVVS